MSPSGASSGPRIGGCYTGRGNIDETHGSKNLKRIGVILQRGILILLITCFPCWALFINIEHILLALKQSPAVANSSPLSCRWNKTFTG
ncbi:multidrug and toxin extrusion protein 1-like [Stegostoma tigrinum]|uniref:multidrug and toxin extrusion protein 1-like n=1 Tax=Stegostoma tigrinum TaxID=3053191 RepID=UPI0028707E23|nr:multidrug and toxin extrusion protein 1-like [Stegostoma tigrinum]